MATQLFLLDTVESGVAITGFDELKLSTARGDNATTSDVAASSSGNHKPIDNLAATATLIWLFRVNAVTISGTVTFNFWGLESAMATNAGLAAIVSRYDSGGTFVSDVVAQANAAHADGVELGTGNALRDWTATPTSTTFADGDWLAVIVHADAVGTMGTGTVELAYDATTAGAIGDSFVTFTETITEYVAGTVDAAALALSLTAVAPSRIDQEVSPGALALALDTPAPDIMQIIDPAAVALALGIEPPSRIDIDLSPAVLALSMTAQAIARTDIDASPEALALALATIAPDFLATIDPSALAIALAVQAPGRIDQDASPVALAVTLGTPAPSVEPQIDPAAIDLALAPVAPTRLDFAVDVPAISLTLSPQEPIRIDFDLVTTVQGLVLTPLAPVRLDQDATLVAIALSLDLPAPAAELDTGLSVEPAALLLALSQGAIGVETDVSPGPVALSVALLSPALVVDVSVSLPALSLVLTAQEPASFDQDVLAEVIALALATVGPEVALAIQPGALGLSLVGPAPTVILVIDSPTAGIRLVSIPIRMSRGGVMASGLVRMQPGPGPARSQRTTQRE